MKKSVKDLTFFKNIKQIREFEFGVFYYFDGLVISEMNEGVVFRWKMAERVIKATHEIFNDNIGVTYISNRINNYYVVPYDWLKFYKNREELNYYAVVENSSSGYFSLFLEGIFFRNSIQKFTDLEEAIEWSISKIDV
jgi:hypothetical protein